MTAILSPRSIEEIMEMYQTSRDRAIFIRALIDGEINGDVMAVDEVGNETSVKFEVVK